MKLGTGILAATLVLTGGQAMALTMSVQKEPGVICIFPMRQQRNACQIRILEIYASQAAYRSHIASAHFQAYKQGTLHMVKRLDLVDMDPLDPEGMSPLFRKRTGGVS